MIEHKCENCAHYLILDYQDNQEYCTFQDYPIENMCDDYFQPKEELVRADELEREIEIKNQIDVVLGKGKYTIKTILQIIKLNDDFIGVMEDGFTPIENYPNENNFNHKGDDK